MSYKEILKQQQPILYQIISKSFKNNKIPHAFLLVGKNARQPAHFIAKSLICENDVLACDHCNECRRIDEHNYGDFIYCNGLEETIKKPHIEYIQEQFSKSALEAILHLQGSLCIARRRASLAVSSGTPAISNITRPGLTTAT